MAAPPAPHVTEDQGAALAFLATPAAHGGQAPVGRIDTHGSIVFLAGERVLKVKRAVRYPYLDYGTLERRRWACEREVALNRRSAPELYLGVSAVTREADGTLALDGTGTPVEWVVAMRRKPDADLLDRRAAARGLDDALLVRAADEVARLHAGAEVVAAAALHGGGSAGLRWVIADNARGLAEYAGLFPPDAGAALEAAAGAALTRCAALLDRRLAEGRVRRCHGDLHLGNLCLWRGRVTLFDALEFDDRLACIDVLYDLAFLLMELDLKLARRAANLVLNRYLRRCGGLERPGELAALAALPLFFRCARRSAPRSARRPRARSARRPGSPACGARRAPISAPPRPIWRRRRRG
jgi:aminoglycoside phosphotransferase family enzyme